jgi:hypothetical protein
MLPRAAAEAAHRACCPTLRLAASVDVSLRLTLHSRNANGLDASSARTRHGFRRRVSFDGADRTPLVWNCIRWRRPRELSVSKNQPPDLASDWMLYSLEAMANDALMPITRSQLKR